MALFKKLF